MSELDLILAEPDVLGEPADASDGAEQDDGEDD